MAADADAYVLYTPPGEDFFCFEPVDHPINAVNLPGGATAHGMTLLAPGERLTRRFAFTVERRCARQCGFARGAPATRVKYAVYQRFAASTRHVFPLSSNRCAPRGAHSLLCVGLDPEPSRFPVQFDGQPDAIFEFCRQIVDAPRNTRARSSRRSPTSPRIARKTSSSG